MRDDERLQAPGVRLSEVEQPPPGGIPVLHGVQPAQVPPALLLDLAQDVRLVGGVGLPVVVGRLAAALGLGALHDPRKRVTTNAPLEDKPLDLAVDLGDAPSLPLEFLSAAAQGPEGRVVQLPAHGVDDGVAALGNGQIRLGPVAVVRAGATHAE